MIPLTAQIERMMGRSVSEAASRVSIKFVYETDTVSLNQTNLSLNQANLFSLHIGLIHVLPIR
jgi:hypothetical protein